MFPGEGEQGNSPGAGQWAGIGSYRRGGEEPRHGSDVAGLVAMVFNLVFVNLVTVGLHFYAGWDDSQQPT